MNVTKLVVLGALESIESGSGYDVMRELTQKMIHKWLDVKTGSVYYTLKQLAEEGAIREIAEVQEGKYPTKVIYEVTEQGRELFDTLQAEAFLGLFPHFYGFKVALKFNTRRSPEEIRQFAEQAVSRIDEQLAAMDRYLSTVDPTSPQYESDAFFIEHDRRLFLAEKQWIQEAATWAAARDEQRREAYAGD